VMKWVETLPDSSLVAMIDGGPAPWSDPPAVGGDGAKAAESGEAVPAGSAEAPSGRDRPRSALVQTLITAVGFGISVTISAILFFGVYVTVPNTRVHVAPALAGAAIGATLWEAGKWGFATYLKFSTGYSQFYGTLALLPLFLLWVYVTWLIVLLGLQIAHSLQTYRTAAAQGLSESVLEALGLIVRKVASRPLRLLEPTSLVLVMSVVAERFAEGKPTDHEHVARRTGIDDQTVGQMLERLAGAGLVLRVADGEQEGTYALARPPQAIPLADILSVAAETRDPPPSPRAAELLTMLARARAEVLSGKTLADAVTGAAPTVLPAGSRGAERPMQSAVPTGA